MTPEITESESTPTTPSGKQVGSTVLLAQMLNAMGANFPNGFCYRVFDANPETGYVYISAAFQSALNDMGMDLKVPEYSEPVPLSHIFPGHGETISLS